MTVHVVATGGTLSSHLGPDGWTNLDGRALVDELGPLPVDVVVEDVATGPSSHLGAADMEAVARRVREVLAAGADGVVITHGTDTMELTAFVVDLLVAGGPQRAPIVFTGSMRAHSHSRADGPANLRDAITVAASAEARGADVLVCLDGRLHAADRVRKRSAASVDAFDSAPFEPVGTVDGDTVRITERPGGHPIAAGLAVEVPLVTCYPGMPAEVFTAAAAGQRGVVIDAFGDLNVPATLWGPMYEAGRAGTLLVVASQVFTPNAGDDDMRRLGAVGAGGLTAQKARLATMAALTEHADRDAAIEFVRARALTYDAGDRSTHE